jgi:site-specific DNA recombinase
LNPVHFAPLKEKFLYLCETLAESGKLNSDDLKKNLGLLEVKLQKLEERFAFGEIDRELFEKAGGKLKQEIQSVRDELDKSRFQLSNPSMLIDQ